MQQSSSSFFFLILCVLFFSPLSPSVSAMSIGFFEEFPSEKSLNALSVLSSEKFSTRIYLAAKNVSELKSWEEKYKVSPSVQEIIWWPVLEKEEGYWISPWTTTEALENLFQDLKEYPEIPVMLDVELPLQRSLLFQSATAHKNKQLIQQFLLDAQKRERPVYTIVTTFFPQPFLEIMGLWYDPLTYGNKPIRMYYSSFRRHLLPDMVVDSMFAAEARKAVQEDALLGIGLIATGVHGNEPVYDTEDLYRELLIAEAAGVEEVIIFRLEGVDEEIAEVLKQVLSKP